MEELEEMKEVEQVSDRQHNGFIKGALIGALLMFLIVAGGMGIFVALGGSIGSTAEDQTVVSAQVEKKLEKIQKLIGEKYLKSDQTDAKALADGLYAGYVNQLGDPYSVYYDEEETKALLESTSGTYSGIGAVLSQDKTTMAITITKVFKDSPAEKGGMKEGDVLNKVDDQSIDGQEISKVVSKIKGVEGTDVKIQVLRTDAGGADNTKADLTMTRAKVETPTVEYEMDEDQIGYISVAEFDTVTYDQFKSALDDLTNQGMKGLIIDLRSNPGGNLQTVTQMLEEILPEGLIVYTEDKDGKKTEFNSDGKNEFQKPLAVLVNGYSASASEIFAGAVQDYGIGTLIGTTTYGKGVVQQLINLDDGTYLKLTIAEYFTPKGRNINGSGIEPDISVDYKAAETEDGNDSQVQKAIDTIKEELNKE